MRPESHLSLCVRIVLATIVITCGAVVVCGQGGTGKLPQRPPRDPPRRPPEVGQGPTGPNYTLSIDKAALNRGAIAGEISYHGPTPKRLKVDMSADPFCRQLNPKFEIEEPLVRRGKLANVFVYIKDGVTADGRKLSELSFPNPVRETLLDQSRCRFLPHVLGIMSNQTLTIRNSDPITNNIHFMPRNNPDWNQTQIEGAAPLTHSFGRADVMVRTRNNQHPWMSAFVGVLNHPFFAVTGEDGAFEIVGVPPGKYTIAAWHEGPGNGSEVKTIVTVKAAP